MANPYTYGALEQRWVVGDATTISRLNVARVQTDHLKYALNQLLDTTNPEDGLNMAASSPMHLVVSVGVVWSVGWWQASGGTWWLLVREAEVASFTRAQADRYIPTGSIDDVPPT